MSIALNQDNIDQINTKIHTDTIANKPSGFNKQIDIGSLSVIDTGVEYLTYDEEALAKLTKDNISLLYKECFKLKNQQVANKESITDEQDNDRPLNTLILPQSSYVFPRSLPVPKQTKDQTKWEKFADAKGITKTKRERMVYSETTGEYAPRWGKGSIKKVEDKAQWLIEDKPKYEGKDPFTFKKQEKKLAQMKQKKHEAKNEESYKGKLMGRKREREDRLSKDKKQTKNALEIAQQSTASLGRHDKLLRNEKPRNFLKNKKIMKKDN